jgi:hypothetical protein
MGASLKRFSRGKFFPSGKSCLSNLRGWQKYINEINVLES